MKRPNLSSCWFAGFRRLLFLWRFVPLMVLSFLFSANAQKDSAKTVYDAWVNFQDDKPTAKGHLCELEDSTVTMSKMPVCSTARLQEIPIANIESLRFREKGGVKDGVVFGATAGFAVGFLVGFIVGNGQQSEQSGPIRVNVPAAPVVAGFAFGLIGTTSGAVLGVLVGSAKVKISLDGSQEKYEKQKEVLKIYRLRK